MNTMKKLMIAAMAMALVAACGTKATTQVSGSVPEGEETVQIVTADIDTTLTVADGKFSIEVPTKVTAISYAVAAGRQVSFIADGSKITVDFEDGEAQSSSKNGVQARFADYQNWNDDFMPSIARVFPRKNSPTTSVKKSPKMQLRSTTSTSFRSSRPTRTTCLDLSAFPTSNLMMMQRCLHSSTAFPTNSRQNPAFRP